jgi:hypothetical protein
MAHFECCLALESALSHTAALESSVALLRAIGDVREFGEVDVQVELPLELPMLVCTVNFPMLVCTLQLLSDHAETLGQRLTAAAWQPCNALQGLPQHWHNRPEAPTM